MELQDHVKTLLSKKMDRKDFLKHVAIGSVALIGGGALLRLTSLEKTPTLDASGPGFGAGAYGGDTNRAFSEPRSRESV